MSDLEQQVIAIVEREADKHGVTSATQLISLELDSLEFVELVGQIETEFGITIPDETWSNFDTVADIIREIENGTAHVSN